MTSLHHYAREFGIKLAGGRKEKKDQERIIGLCLLLSPHCFGLAK